MKITGFWFGLLLFPLSPVQALDDGCDPAGNSVQQILATGNLPRPDFWSPLPGEIRTLTMVDGFKVGVRIDPPEAKVYDDWPGDGVFVPELVKITLYDMSGERPVYLTHTYGGSNSLQGYSERGGADRVEQLKGDGLRMQLIRPHCIRLPSDPAE